MGMCDTATINTSAILDFLKRSRMPPVHCLLFTHPHVIRICRSEFTKLKLCISGLPHSHAYEQKSLERKSSVTTALSLVVLPQLVFIDSLLFCLEKNATWMGMDAGRRTSLNNTFLRWPPVVKPNFYNIPVKSYSSAFSFISIHSVTGRIQPGCLECFMGTRLQIFFFKPELQISCE